MTGKKFAIMIVAVLALGATTAIPNCNSSSDMDEIGGDVYLGATLYVGGSGLNNYTKIQDAINAAKDDDTVFVYSGIYYENVVIDKIINLVGEDRNNTIIDAGGNGDIVKISADYASTSGFTIRKGGGRWGDAGIDIQSSYNTILDNNIIPSNSHGIWLDSSSNNNIILNNTISSNNYCSICFWSSNNNNTISGNTISSKHGHGIWLNSSCNINIFGNIISSNYLDGICLEHSTNNSITSNLINSCKFEGICFKHSSDNTILNNSISNNDCGISLGASSNNTISSNSISNNDRGIGLYSSTNNTISDNSFFNDGIDVEDSYQNTVYNNTVNGKPLVYLKNESDMIIGDAGQVILIGCDNITIRNQELSNTTVGIGLWDTDNCLISDNTISNDETGISLHYSSNNTISGNTINSNNQWGVLSFHCKYNTISNNTILKNLRGIELLFSYNSNIIGNIISSTDLWGISFGTSSNNTILANTLSNNDIGVALGESSFYSGSSENNTLYHNNFINNTNQACDSYSNIWDNGYPSGGNYWSDFDEPSEGAYDSNSDGIVDSPYNIWESTQDRYPLMNPVANGEDEEDGGGIPAFDLVSLVIVVVSIILLKQRNQK